MKKIKKAVKAVKAAKKKPVNGKKYVAQDLAGKVTSLQRFEISLPVKVLECIHELAVSEGRGSRKNYIEWLVKMHVADKMSL
jgi:hypothetical protein